MSTDNLEAPTDAELLQLWLDRGARNLTHQRKVAKVGVRKHIIRFYAESKMLSTSKRYAAFINKQLLADQVEGKPRLLRITSAFDFAADGPYECETRTVDPSFVPPDTNAVIEYRGKETRVLYAVLSYQLDYPTYANVCVDVLVP